jgi:hypothetical protein
MEAAAACCETLAPVVGFDWSVPAGNLEWDCRRTLEHIVEVPLFYARHLASGARERIPHGIGPDPAVPVADLLASVVPMAAVLARVIEATPAGTRAFHPAAMADASGFAGMGCDEILVHTGDIAAGFHTPFSPPRDLCRKVLGRLFPWAPGEGDAWRVLLWANGRAEIPGYPRLGPDWVWHCAPLDEWDGTVPTFSGR